MTNPVTIGDCTLYLGDCLEVLATVGENSIDSCVTAPPYHLTSIVKRFGSETAAPAKVGKTGAYARSSKGFMGKQWDGGDVAFRPETWAAVYRVLKPGAHLLAFSGTRTYHRMACAIEDAGFEVRDMIQWVYGSGFPKSHDVSKAIDKAAGAKRDVIGIEKNFGKARVVDGENAYGDYAGKWEKTSPATKAACQWQGWGTALKPACEPICVARKPLIGTVAANVLEHGTGALNIDEGRVGAAPGDYDHPGNTSEFSDTSKVYGWAKSQGKYKQSPPSSNGRWPANLAHDGSEEVLRCFPDSKAGKDKGGGKPCAAQFGDSGSPARFFYCPKASKADRLGSKHPTVKPVNLMRWLVRLVTPPGGIVLDPFAGSGSTGMACLAEGFLPVLIELEAESIEDIKRRIGHVSGSDGDLFAPLMEQEALL